ITNITNNKIAIPPIPRFANPQTNTPSCRAQQTSFAKSRHPLAIVPQTNPKRENATINQKSGGINNIDGGIKPKSGGINKKTIADLESILHFINENPFVKSSQIEEFSNKSATTIERYIKILKDNNLIEHIGARKTGGYHIKPLGR
ncbi:MAG: hypothetical protein LBU91_00850, partial [Bacteroidales bacterium]|nr:hypothetical protein [Bacteroidales bacterium]